MRWHFICVIKRRILDISPALGKFRFLPVRVSLDALKDRKNRSTMRERAIASQEGPVCRASE